MCSILSLILAAAFTTSDYENKLSLHPTIVRIHEELQKQRQKHGKSVLKLDEECCQLAQAWANYMADNKKFHHGKDEQIIARGYKNIKSLFRGWMNSGSHRSWILNNKYTKCGWGCQQSEGGMLYWVGVFRK